MLSDAPPRSSAPLNGSKPSAHVRISNLDSRLPLREHYLNRVICLVVDLDHISKGCLCEHTANLDTRAVLGASEPRQAAV